MCKYFSTISRYKSERCHHHNKSNISLVGTYTLHSERGQGSAKAAQKWQCRI